MLPKLLSLLGSRRVVILRTFATARLVNAFDDGSLCDRLVV